MLEDCEREKSAASFIEQAPAAWSWSIATCTISPSVSAGCSISISPAHSSAAVTTKFFPKSPKRGEWHQRCLAGAVEKTDGRSLCARGRNVLWLKRDVRPWRDTRGTSEV